MKRKANILFVCAGILSGVFLVLSYFSWVLWEELPSAFMLRSGDYLLNLVNRENSLGDYEPSDLTDLSAFGARGLYIRKIAYGHLRDMVVAAQESNRLPLKILSPYRSRMRQQALHVFYKKHYPDAENFSAQPGHSEHQLGTTVDFGVGDPRIDLSEAFGETSQGQWLHENAWRYGFVQSYPQGKDLITGFQYEPWHLRFIGVDAAREWHDSGLTLNEYLSGKAQYYAWESLAGRFVRPHDGGEIYAVQDGGYKRHIPSAAILASYGVTEADVTPVAKEILEELPTANLVRQTASNRVYYMEPDGGARRWVATSQLFEALGFSWEGVAAISAEELRWHREGPPMSLHDSSAEIIGRSVQERPLHAFRLGSGPQKILFVGGLHTGDEDNTRRLAERALEHFMAYPEDIPADVTLLIMPNANPDGTALGIHNNSHNVDLNRNWPAHNWTSRPYHPTYGYLEGAGGADPLSEPETRALYDFIMRERPVMTFVWHSQGALVEDNDTGSAHELAKIYAKASGYTHIDEWAYYRVTGTFSDAMKEQNIAAADIELRSNGPIDWERNLLGIRAALARITRRDDNGR